MAVTDTLTKSTLSMTGASVALLAADPSRRSVIVSNPSGNGPAAIDPSGGNAAQGIPLLAGYSVEITGMPAKGPITALGNSGQSLVVFVGR